MLLIVFLIKQLNQIRLSSFWMVRSLMNSMRLDNITPICPSCGIRQALSAAGIDADAQNSIVSLIEEKEAEYEGHAAVN